MVRTKKLTISIPEELASFADTIAMKRKISRSQVFSACLKELSEKQKITEMAEGYKALAQEQKEWADMAGNIEREVIPEWK